MSDIRTAAYTVESITVYADDSIGELSVEVHALDPGAEPDQDLMILDRDDNLTDGTPAPGCPMTIDGRKVDRWELLRWVVATRDVRIEVDVDFDMYSRIVAARFTAGAPAG